MGYPREDFDPYKKFFITFFRCYEKGYPIIEKADYNGYSYDVPETFTSKSAAMAKAKKASKELFRYYLRKNRDDAREYGASLDMLNDECHILAVVKNGDDYEFNIVGCFLDGVEKPELVDNKDVYKSIMKLS